MAHKEDLTEALEGLIGRRVALVRSGDPYTRIKPGTEGTIDFVDSLGTLHVKWDDGSNLGLIPGEDTFDILPVKS